MNRFVSATCAASMLLAAACGKAGQPVDHSAPPDTDKVLAHLPEALESKDLKRQNGKDGGITRYLSKKDGKPFNGWIKSTRGDGAVRLNQVIDGVEDGATVTFYGKTKKIEGNRKGVIIQAGGGPMDAGWLVDGKRHGAYVFFDKEGKVAVRKRYENGEILESEGNTPAPEIPAALRNLKDGKPVPPQKKPTAPLTR